MKKSMFKAAIISMLIASAVGIAGCGSSSSNDSAKNTTKQEQQEIKWNKSEPDAMKNGNIALAAKEVKNNTTLAASATDQDPAAVIKAPWDYYGKVIKFTGTVALVQAMPPESDVGKAMGGQCGEIVIEAQDTIIDAIIAGDVTNIQEDQQVTFYAYPVGRTEVQNKLGGTFTHLVVVGRLN